MANKRITFTEEELEDIRAISEWRTYRVIRSFSTGLPAAVELDDMDLMYFESKNRVLSDHFDTLGEAEEHCKQLINEMTLGELLVAHLLAKMRY